MKEIDKGKLIELWNDPLVRLSDIEKQLNISAAVARRRIKSYGITSRKACGGKNKVLKIDSKLKEAKSMWLSSAHTLKDICKKFSCDPDTVRKRARENDFGSFVQFSFTKFEKTMESLRKIIIYDKDTGHFYWKEDRNFQNLKGMKAGSLTHNGYIIISIGNIRYYAHNLVILYEQDIYPPDVGLIADHLDHNRSNNVYTNLELKTPEENRKNSSLRCDNTTGICGVSITKDGNYTVRGYNKNLGTFTNIKDAIDVRKQWEDDNGYHKNSGKPAPIDYYTNSRRHLKRKQTPEGEDKKLLKLVLDSCPEGYENDHIVPLSKGGLHSVSNIQYITKEENRSKGNKYPYECKTAIRPEDVL